ncbi:MAG: 23S rRNA (guanosine(2251)-2'-O)-methyltransferase RlmB [Candidatus Omnitrophota bacterium]
MYLYGKKSVAERLKANPGSINRILIQDGFSEPGIEILIKAGRVPVKRVSEKELSRIKRADRLQGIVAEVGPFSYTPFEELIYDSQKKDRSFIFVDGLNDPHNLGAIMRTAACFGGFALVIPQHGACGVTDAVMHVSSGGENYVPVCMVTNMVTALLNAKKEGFWVAGAVVEGGQDINAVSLPFPLCLVLGSEGKGIRHGVRKHIDVGVTLPMRGAALSFNVAMACAIFCHEIAKQRSIGNGQKTK